jgi:hypothetical protein
LIVILWLLGLLGAKAMAADGLTTVQSNYGPGVAENRWVKFEFARRDFRVHIVDNNTAA